MIIIWTIQDGWWEWNVRWGEKEYNSREEMKRGAWRNRSYCWASANKFLKGLENGQAKEAGT